MVILFAAGNDTNDITSPGTAKNVITVGAAESVQPISGADGCGTPDSQADNANAISYFSGSGPCADGRHKPNLVAPGTHISGGVPQAPNPGPDGNAASCFSNSAPSITLASAGAWAPTTSSPPASNSTLISTGTSHATPAVSGGCALLRQYFINQGRSPPSAAMTKAFLMNSARYMTGPGAADSLFSDNQGMGEMDLGTAFDGEPRLLRDELPGDLFTASGQTRSFSGAIADTNRPSA